MARKSNKTSHVLNLLAGEESVPEAEEKKRKKKKTIQRQKLNLRNLLTKKRLPRIPRKYLL